MFPTRNRTSAYVQLTTSGGLRLVDLLAANEREYQAVALGLMLEISNMESFPNLRGQQDGEHLIAKAREAVAELKAWTAKHQELVTERAKSQEERAKAAAKAANSRALVQKLDELKAKFFELHTATNPQRRGQDFELFLNDLCAPRMQRDGDGM